MIIITGTIPTAPETHDDIVRLCTQHSIRSRSEPGCISHNIHIDCEDSARLFFFEQWADEAAVAAHFAVPESRELVKRLTALVGHRPEMKMYRANAISPEELG